MASTARSTDALEHSYWAVLFLDLLGQQEAFLATDFMPGDNDHEARERLHSAIRWNLAAIDLLHSSMARFTREDPYLHVLRPDSPLLGLPIEAQVLARKWKSAKTRSIAWSDGIACYSSLVETDSHFPITALYSLIAGAGIAFLQLLSVGKPARGGIDVGTAVETRGQLFGAAVVKAYQLESRRAKHPRILVGDSVRRYLSSVPTPTPLDLTAQFRKAEAEQIGSMIAKDEDGLWMVNYLGAEFRDLFDEHAEETFQMARHFVVESRDYWAKEGNENRSQRYAVVARYFEKNAQFWVPS